MQRNNSNITKKIVIMGLDDSGKSSIVLCLKGVKNLTSFSAIKPTRVFEINKFNTMGSDFNIWDFGGQEKFREDYVKNFKNHIKGTNKLIYVLDIQDRDRYALSLQYLAKIIALLQENKLNPEFSLFLHKFDPDLELINREINEDLIQTLIKQIKDIIPQNFPHQIYTTSIYTVFQKSAIN
jgi:small GTP-binding protein